MKSGKMFAVIFLFVVAVACGHKTEVALSSDTPAAAAAATAQAQPEAADQIPSTLAAYKVVKTEAEWRRILTPEQYRVVRQKGTERPYTGKYHDHKGKGTYQCVACGQDLFSSETKFDSGTGWPSFWAAVAKENVREEVDDSLSERRTEVLCARCGGHLGHVFDDGPEPTGLRYCINSASLNFVKRH
ncbi:MAG: peptide-methionine (R)-S-oxide reductase MsrB [Pyrinomonadaceae bacterium]